MREKLRQGGGEALADHEILEMLLYYSISRINTNETAHRLIERFGSLSGVLNAKRHELTAVPGVGAQSADLIILVSELYRRTDREDDKVPRQFKDLDDVGRYLVKLLDGLSRERVLVLLLTADFRLIATHQISEGSVNTSGVDIRQIMEYAILAKASHIVLAHNHPDPMPTPSPEDESVSVSLMHAATVLNLNLWEHILVSDGQYVCILREMLERKPYYSSIEKNVSKTKTGKQKR
ncbi:MAG: DNA repair protein RadC [Clostridia bacterium]|nr:DNA repair protein RadC [Clostridia bacterium]